MTEPQTVTDAWDAYTASYRADKVPGKKTVPLSPRTKDLWHDYFLVVRTAAQEGHPLYARLDVTSPIPTIREKEDDDDN